MRIKRVSFVRIVCALMTIVFLFNSCIFVTSVSAEMTDVHRDEIRAGLDEVTQVEDIEWVSNCVEIYISNILMDDISALDDYVAYLEDIPKYSWIDCVNTICVNEIDGVQYINGAYIKVKDQYVNEDGSINKEQARIDGEAEKQAMDKLKDKVTNGQFAEGLAEVIANTIVTSNRVEIDISSLGMTDDEVKNYGLEISKAVYANEDCYWVSRMQLSGDIVTVYVKDLYMISNTYMDKEKAKSDFKAMKERLDNGELEDIIEEAIDSNINNMIDYYTSVILRVYIDNVFWMSGLTEHEFDVCVWKMREKTKYFFFEDLNLQCVDNRYYVYGFTWRGEIEGGYEDWEITREKDIDKWCKLQVKAKGLYECLEDDRLSDLEKVLLIYNWLMREVEYDYENYKYYVIPRKSYSIKGVLVDGKIVCEGYADTMKYFLDYAGIDNYKVSGKTGPTDEAHAWNVVKLDGKWYHLDATWDDYGKDESYEGEWEHTYFLLSDEEIKALQHNEWWGNEYDCTDSGSYEDYIFRYYGMAEVGAHKGVSQYNYYDGYWYYAQNGTFYAKSIMKSKIDGSDSSVFKSFDEYIISSYIYEDYMYVATATALYKINMLDGSDEIILSKNSEWGNDGYISEFVMKDNRLKIDICKAESDGTTKEFTEYIDLITDEATTISINQQDVTVNVGGSSQLTATTNYVNSAEIKWWSMDVNTLTIDSDGVMHGKAEGDVVVMCAVNGALASTTVKVKPAFVYGDANNDDGVDLKDAVLLKQHLAGMSELDINMVAADVDLDGIVDIKDVVKVMQFLAGFDIQLGRE